MSGPPRYAQRKDENQAEIVAALERIGADVFVLHEPADLLVGMAGRTLLVEIKNPKKPPSKRRLTPAQVKFHAQWRGHKAVVHTPEQAIAAVMEAVK